MLYRSRFSVGGIFDSLAYAAHFVLIYNFALSIDSLLEDRFRLWTDMPFELVMLLSRVVLAIQYSWALWLARHDERLSTPLGLVLMTKLCVLISWAMVPMLAPRWVWFAIVGLDTVADTVIGNYFNANKSSINVVYERMNNMTLVVLGSGLLAFAKAFLALEISGISRLNMLDVSNINCFILVIVSRS